MVILVDVAMSSLLLSLRTQVPGIPEWILNRPRATAVRLVRGRGHRDRAFSIHCALIRRVTIVDLHHEMHRLRLPWAVRLAHLDDRVSKPHLRVLHDAIR